MVASASRDQTVRVFDIRAMKEYRVLKGHKKEVCCMSSVLPYPTSSDSSTAVTWHPVHPLLVSGGSEGAILHWDLATPEPSFAQPISPPRATLSQAHDSNVWSLAFHPLGHLLVSASNDHTTRFWSRERPGDSSSVFSGGGEKPPEVTDMSGQDEDDDAMVPGFSYRGAGSTWWGKDEDTGGEGYGAAGAGAGAGAGSGAGSGASYENGRKGGGYADSATADDFIPGFGATETSVTSRQSGPLPSQEDMYGTGGPDEWNRNGGGGGMDDWNRGGNGAGGLGAGAGAGGGNRQGRWGPRRGGGGSGGGRY
jgi:polyadenylation factor subunit 2